MKKLNGYEVLKDAEKLVHLDDLSNMLKVIAGIELKTKGVPVYYCTISGVKTAVVL